jgi:hypothetical protein
VAQKTKRKSFDLWESQDRFIDRKVDELRRRALPGEEHKINRSTVMQGLISFWQAMDAGRKTSPPSPHK